MISSLRFLENSQESNYYTLNPFKGSNTSSTPNFWQKYFAKNTTEKISTSDGIAKLNEENQNTSNTKKTEESQKLAKEQKKIKNLCAKMQKQGVLKLSKKHDAALKLIKNNPSLAFLYDAIINKINALMEQQQNLIANLLESLNGESTSERLNQIAASVTKSNEKLMQDGQKIGSGIMKIGAYSEAMLLVNDDKKKDKYMSLAISIENGLPNAKENKTASSSRTETAEIEETQDDDNSNDIAEETSNNPFNFSITENTSSQNPFSLENNNEVASSKVEEENSDDNEESSTQDYGEKEIESEGKDSEIQTLKAEVKEELKKQKEDKKVITDSTGKALNSVLFG